VPDVVHQHQPKDAAPHANAAGKHGHAQHAPPNSPCVAPKEESMDRKTIEVALRKAAIRCGCDPEQAEDIITEFWVIHDED
jgi:hypothetical protein